MDPCERYNENNVIWLHPLSAMQVLLDYQLIIALPLAYIMAKRCVCILGLQTGFCARINWIKAMINWIQMHLSVTNYHKIRPVVLGLHKE